MKAETRVEKELRERNPKRSEELLIYISDLGSQETRQIQDAVRFTNQQPGRMNRKQLLRTLVYYYASNDEVIPKAEE